MRTKLRNSMALFFCLATAIPGYSQDSLSQRTHAVSQEFYEESLRREKILPDKVFEVGIVFLLVFLVTNSVISVFRVNAERRIKEKALDKGISEATLVELFRQDRNAARNNTLKWFLILAALGISLIYIYLMDKYQQVSSGAFSLGLISLFMSIAFLIYYRIIRRQ